MITLKLQYSNFEEGEFTNEKSIDFVTFYQLFDKEDNNKVISKYSWTLENDRLKYYIQIENTYFLIIEHIARDGYCLTYCNCNEKYAYSNNFYNYDIIDLAKLFFISDYKTLTKKLIKNKSDASYIINRFENLDFNYNYLDNSTTLSNLTLLIYLIIVVLFFMFAEFTTGIILMIVFSVFGFFNVVIYKNHSRESENKSIKISSGNEKIFFSIEDKEFSFFKKDIFKIRFVYDCGKISLLQNFNYTQFFLNNGSILNISNMIVEPAILEKKLNSIKKENKIRYFPFIKPKTNIKIF
ncbi:MAG: hypothetical protein ACOYO1_14655 [Bacteroidales bacterium]